MINQMTSGEIKALIFKGVGDCSKPVPMPIWIAEHVIKMPWLDRHLSDWAWNTIAEYIDG